MDDDPFVPKFIVAHYFSVFDRNVERKSLMRVRVVPFAYRSCSIFIDVDHDAIARPIGGVSKFRIF